MRITEGSILEGEKQPHPVDVSINKLFEDLIEGDEDIKDKVALVNSETSVTVTYKELNEKANRVARALLGRIKNGAVKTNSDGDYIVAVRWHLEDTLYHEGFISCYQVSTLRGAGCDAPGRVQGWAGLRAPGPQLARGQGSACY